MSSRLSSESRIYADKARDLNRQVSHYQLSGIMHMISYIFVILLVYPFSIWMMTCLNLIRLRNIMLQLEIAC